MESVEHRGSLSAFTRHSSHRDEPQRVAAVVLDFIGTTSPMLVDENRWRDRLRSGRPSTVAS
jgi:hypothetical protein